MPAVLGYPSINGARPDWARVGISVFGINSTVPIPTKGFRSLRYAARSNGELVLANAQIPVGQTTGQIVPTGSMTMLLPEYNQLVAALGAANGGGGIYTSLFNLFISYNGVDDTGTPYTLNDFLYGVRISGSDRSHRSSGAALEVNVDIMPTYIVENGVLPDDVDDFAALQAAYLILANV